MNEFEITTVINRPPADVFAALLNFEKAPDWNPGLTEVRLLDDGPIKVGSTIVYVGKFLGRSYESTSACVELEPNLKYSSKTVSGPFMLEIDSVLEAVEGGTKLTNLYRGESQGFFKLAEPVVIRLTKRQFETANENFKEMLEGGVL